MPRLLMLAACEKVITSNEDNSGSLISILQGFEIPIPPPPDERVVAPVTWYAFALWESTGEEPGRFVQRIQLIGPDPNAIIFSSELPIVSPEHRTKRFHRHAIKTQGFPLVGIGDYTLKIAIRDGDGDFVDLPNSFPIPVALVASPNPPGK